MSSALCSTKDRVTEREKKHDKYAVARQNYPENWHCVLLDISLVKSADMVCVVR